MSLGNAYVPVGEVITFAAQEIGDEEFGRLGRPFYLSAAQRALVEMNYQTQFYKKIFEAAIPDDLIIELPCDLTGKDMVLLFNGSNCDIGRSTVLFIKPNMWHKGGSGYVANNRGFNPDPLQWSSSWTQTQPCLHFAGEHMGKLYLSEGCARYEKLHITYTGLGMEDIGEDFEVPYWCREAITDFIVDRAAKAMLPEAPQLMKYRIDSKQSELKDARGSWHQAVIRYKLNDRKGRYDTDAYTHRFGHFP